MKPCSRPDCQRHAVARGLCASHYQQWHRQRPALLGFGDSRKEILAAMPGTRKEIAERTGLSMFAVVKMVTTMQQDDPACMHVADNVQDFDVSGSRYVEVLAAGPGKDKRVSKAKKHENTLRQRRRVYAAKLAKARGPDPLVRALFGNARAIGGGQADI